MAAFAGSVALATGAFVSALLVLLHIRTFWTLPTAATLCLIVWLAAVSFVVGVDALVWSQSVEVKLEVWCDIVTRLQVGANLALPATWFRQWMIIHGIIFGTDNRALAKAKMRRRAFLDFSFLILFPVLYMALFHIIQRHRFNLIETLGCRASTFASIPEFFFMWFIPILLALGTVCFIGVSLVQMLRLGKKILLTSSSQVMRYTIMILAQVLWFLLIVSLYIFLDYQHGLHPWVSWDEVHSDFSRIETFPRSSTPPLTLRLSHFVSWGVPVAGYIFVLLSQPTAELWKQVTGVFRRSPADQQFSNDIELASRFGNPGV
ncbi:hypothetical protein NLI96_g3884 [Meripilus lineatus]|uniref:Fungal pheromone STE3G-protein-coupled receptor n=1 Tax=Meripilus lineatus TaxID=2056292 RepID=A0AAD5V662_9APHY|nr:hypothetical protein NLI96_g3884 [Physisporinus lineatus]